MSTLSAQVLRLLDRVNSWTAQQTFLAGRLPLVAEGTITHAQILAMRTTPITAVVAPGSGKIIVPRYLRCLVDTTHGAYTGSITAGGTQAWFGLNLGSFSTIYLVNDSTLGTNVTAGVPLPATVLPGYDPTAFTQVFAATKKSLVQFSAMRYQDFTVGVWGVLEYGYDTTLWVDSPAQFMMGNDGAVANLGGGGSGNALYWHFEYDIVTLP